MAVHGLKFWAVQNFVPRTTPFLFFPASCHIYKSTVARLKLDINANNIVCFTVDHFSMGFGRDKVVKRCVAGSYLIIAIQTPTLWLYLTKRHTHVHILTLSYKTQNNHTHVNIMILSYKTHNSQTHVRTLTLSYKTPYTRPHPDFILQQTQYPPTRPHHVFILRNAQ